MTLVRLSHTKVIKAVSDISHILMFDASQIRMARKPGKKRRKLMEDSWETSHNKICV